jgi:hypothetical protein
MKQERILMDMAISGDKIVIKKEAEKPSVHWSVPTSF